MAPRADLTSTGYALANPGKEYLVLQPNETNDGFEVRLAEPVQTRAHARTASRTSAETERSCDSAIRKRSRTCDFGSRAESFECSSLFRTMVRCSAMGASVFLASPATRAP